MIATTRRVKRKLTDTEEHNIKGCLVHVCEFLNGDGISAVMALYPYDEEMQQGCCRALANTLAEFVSENSKVKYTIARWMSRMSHKSGSADETTLAAMLNFPENEHIQAYGCSIISNLTSLAPQKCHFIGSEAAEIVCAAMYSFPASHLIQIEGCNAISSITNGNCRKTTRVLNVSEMCDVVVRAMTRFETVEDQQVRGLVALSHVLSWLGYNTESLMLLGVSECIVATARRYPVNESIQNLACESFKYLSTSGDAIDGLLRSGVVDFVFTAMRAFPLAEDIQTDGVYVLLRIIEQENADLVALVEAGLGEVVFAAAETSTEIEYTTDLIFDACNIVRQVVLRGRLPRETVAKFRPIGGGSVFDAVEVIHETFLALDTGYLSGGDSDFEEENRGIVDELKRLREALLTSDALELTKTTN